MMVTVFTPTYNRAHTLHRVYESLISQTVTDFEWIIVDDGSKDDTPLLVRQWCEEAKLSIRFIQQTNKGKFNTLVEIIKHAKGDWFLIADSDDAFEPDTIEVFLDVYNKQPDNIKQEIAGVSCLVKDSVTKQIVGGVFPMPPGKDYLLSNVNEISFKFGVRGEKWGILKTSVLREFVEKLPDTERSPYISENVLWSPIATKYKTVYINKPLRIYFQGTSDTLSTRNIAGRFPLGAWISERVILPCIFKYFWWQPKMIALSAVKLNYSAIAAGKTLSQTIYGFPFLLKVFVLLTKPLGRLAFLKFPKQKIK